MAEQVNGEQKRPPDLRMADCCLSCVEYRPISIEIHSGYCLRYRCERIDTDVCNSYVRAQKVYPFPRWG